MPRPPTSATAPNVAGQFRSGSAAREPITDFLLRIETSGEIAYYSAPFIPYEKRARRTVTPAIRAMDFQLQRCTRHCGKTGRDLKPGDSFYSVLVAQGADVVRYDYSQEVWEGPPEEALGWWKSQMPNPLAKKIHWAPNDVMLHYFEQLPAVAEQDHVRYVLSLLLLRRRIVRLEEKQRDKSGREIMLLYCSRNETEYRVTVCEPDGERIQAIQQELGRLLFAHAE